MDSYLPSKKTAAITSYDFLKSLAVITMIIDHLGYYFFPEEMIFRAIGRVSFPIWFFLVGYARSREIGPRLIGGAIILALVDGMIGIGVFPLNILVAIIIIRLIRERVAGAIIQNEISFYIFSMLLLLLSLPSYLVIEYGTQGILMTMLGWMARNRPSVPGIGSGRRVVAIYFLLAVASYISQQIFFNFERPELFVLGACLIAVITLLYNFRPVSYPDLTARWPEPVIKILQFMGRRTLEIYVGHLLLFKLWGVIHSPERFPLFHWEWVV